MGSEEQAIISLFLAMKTNQREDAKELLETIQWKPETMNGIALMYKGGGALGFETKLVSGYLVLILQKPKNGPSAQN